MARVGKAMFSSRFGFMQLCTGKTRAFQKEGAQRVLNSRILNKRTPAQADIGVMVTSHISPCGPQIVMLYYLQSPSRVIKLPILTWFSETWLRDVRSWSIQEQNRLGSFDATNVGRMITNQFPYSPFSEKKGSRSQTHLCIFSSSGPAPYCVFAFAKASFLSVFKVSGSIHRVEVLWVYA